MTRAIWCVGLCGCLSNVDLDLPQADDARAWLLIESPQEDPRAYGVDETGIRIEADPDAELIAIAYPVPLDDLALSPGPIALSDAGRPIPLLDPSDLHRSDASEDSRRIWTAGSTAAIAGLGIDGPVDRETCFEQGGCSGDDRFWICERPCEATEPAPPSPPSPPQGVPDEPVPMSCNPGEHPFRDGCRAIGSCPSEVPPGARIVGPLDDLQAAADANLDTPIFFEGDHLSVVLRGSAPIRGRCGSDRIEQIQVYSDVRLENLSAQTIEVRAGGHLSLSDVVAAEVFAEGDLDADQVAFAGLEVYAGANAHLADASLRNRVACRSGNLTVTRARIDGPGCMPQQVVSSTCSLDLVDVDSFGMCLSVLGGVVRMDGFAQSTPQQTGLRAVGMDLTIDRSRFSRTHLVKGEGRAMIRDAVFTNSQDVDTLVLEFDGGVTAERLRIESVQDGIDIGTTVTLSDVEIVAGTTDREALAFVVRQRGSATLERLHTRAIRSWIRGSATVSDWNSEGVVEVGETAVFGDGVDARMTAKRLAIAAAFSGFQFAGLRISAGIVDVEDLTILDSTTGVLLTDVSDLTVERFSVETISTGIDIGTGIDPRTFRFDRGTISSGDVGILYPEDTAFEDSFVRTRFLTQPRTRAR